MAGYVYHLRPSSNIRFCKVGMTNGRDPQDRIKELNNSCYGGFSDWYLASKILVKDPSHVETFIHTELQQFKVPLGSEQEVFVCTKEEIDSILLKFSGVPVAEYAHLEQKLIEAKNQILILQEQIQQIQAREQKSIENAKGEIKIEYEREIEILTQAHQHKLEKIALNNSESPYSRKQVRKMRKNLDAYIRKYGELERF